MQPTGKPDESKGPLIAAGPEDDYASVRCVPTTRNRGLTVRAKVNRAGRLRATLVVADPDGQVVSVHERHCAGRQKRV